MDGLCPASLHRSVEPARTVVTPLTVCSVDQNNRKLSLPKVAQVNNQENFRKLLSNMLKNKWNHVKVLLKKFHLNGHILGFHAPTKKLELHSK